MCFRVTDWREDSVNDASSYNGQGLEWKICETENLSRTAYSDDIGQVGFHVSAEFDPTFAAFHVHFFVRLDFEIPLDGRDEVDNAEPNHSVKSYRGK